MGRNGDGAATQRTRQQRTRRQLTGQQLARQQSTTQQTQEQDSRAEGLDTGWTVFSYLIGGMIAYGAIGWLIGRAVHIGLLFPLGMLAGLAISLGYVIYRFGRQESFREAAEASQTRRQGGKE